MTIFDGNGRTIEEAQLSAQHGVVYIDAAEWDAGIYIITLQTREGEGISERFVVNH